jgi:integrase/recombinase XerD
MTPLRQPMIAALQRRGKGARTQASSVRAVRLLAQCSGKSPPVIAAQELQDSLLHRRHVDGLAPASLRLGYRGIRCCSPHVLTRAWHTLSCMRAHTSPRLPAVLRVEEVRRLLPAATPVHTPVSCTTVYRVGLRLHAARALPVSALAGPRLQVPVHRGTGATDRDSPLPQDPLALLRPSWTTHRHTPWLLPATGRAQLHRPPAPSPRRRSRVHGACRTATPRARLPTTGVALPPLRHASATPLRAAGVPPRRIQRSLGHPQRATTLVSCHLTPQGPDEASARLNPLLHGLLPCPPCVPSSRPSPQRTWSTLPPSPPCTARSSALSPIAHAGPRATASRRATAGGGHPASSIPVATATVPRARSRHPRSGDRITWTPRSRGRPSS